MNVIKMPAARNFRRAGLAVLLCAAPVSSISAACLLAAGSHQLPGWTSSVGGVEGQQGTSLSIAEKIVVPADCDVTTLTVRIQWSNADADLGLRLTSPNNAVNNYDADPAGSFEQAVLNNPPTGDYLAQATNSAPFSVEFSGTATIVVAEEDPLDGIPSAPNRPRVIVADIDSAINPYHAAFYTGGPIYGATTPASVTREVLEALGVPPENVVQLTRTGNFAADVAADQEFWDSVVPGELYYFKGTNVIATSRVGPGLPALKPSAEKSAHGLGTSAAVLGANPAAILLFVETEGDLGNDAAHELAFLDPDVDIITTSYGVSIPGTGIPLPETRAFNDTYESVVLRGKLHFSSGGNGPGLTPTRAGAGPWWSIGVSGIEEGSSEGDTLLSGLFPDFVSDFTQTLPYCMDCETGLEEFVAGTSFSTPRAAGVASKVLLRARQLVKHAGGIKLVDGVPMMASGKGFNISNWFLRRALEQAAWIPGIEEYDPIEGVFDVVGLPINPLVPWLQIAWGDLTGVEEKEVIAKALGHLNLGVRLNRKAPGYCEFQSLIIQERKLYWDTLAPILPDIFGGEQTGSAPSTDPFIYCESLLPYPVANDPGGRPVDSDKDLVVDGLDNCPNAANTDQADTDNDGIGNVCEGSATPTPSPTATATPTPTPSAIPTPTPTAIPTATPSATPTQLPTGTPVPTPYVTNWPTATPMPTATPSATPGEPAVTPTPTAIATPTAVPTTNSDLDSEEGGGAMGWLALLLLSGGG
ncbi:MAG: hypothetical protein M3O62_17610, partial [Pseudomonadota bacterium]|nr:hypothetical protein [Pseudomonadota bacterium]